MAPKLPPTSPPAVAPSRPLTAPVAHDCVTVPSSSPTSPPASVFFPPELAPTDAGPVAYDRLIVPQNSKPISPPTCALPPPDTAPLAQELSTGSAFSPI